MSSTFNPRDPPVLPFAIAADVHADPEEASPPSEEAQLISSMGHSFRTPLNQILGFAELLTEQLSGPLNDKQVRQAEGIYRAGERLLEVANDLVLLAEVSTGAVGGEVSGCSDLVAHLASRVASADDEAATPDIVGTLPADGWVALSGPWLERLVTSMIAPVSQLADSDGGVTLTCTKSDGRVKGWILSLGWTMPNEEVDDRDPVRWFSYSALAAHCERRVHGSGVQLLLAQRIATAAGGTVLAHTDGGTRFSVECVLPQSAQEGAS